MVTVCGRLAATSCTARSGCVTGRGTSTPACALRPTRTRGNRTVESGTLHVQPARHRTVSASYLPQCPWLPSFMRLTRAPRRVNSLWGACFGLGSGCSGLGSRASRAELPLFDFRPRTLRLENLLCESGRRMPVLRIGLFASRILPFGLGLGYSGPGRRVRSFHLRVCGLGLRTSDLGLRVADCLSVTSRARIHRLRTICLAIRFCPSCVFINIPG